MRTKKKVGFKITREFVGKPEDIWRLKDLQRRLLERYYEQKKRKPKAA